MSPPCKCFVPELDRRGWNALLSSWLCVQYGAMVGLGSDRWYLRCSACSAVELSKLDMKNGPNHFLAGPFHSTNIRQYSILTVTVKLCGQLAEVERVLPLVFRRRGVRQFAAFEPLADEVA